MTIPFFKPQLDEAALVNVADCLSNGWLTTGPWNEKFEQNLAKYFGGECEVILVNSATAGLHLSLVAAGVGPGDEVIVPTLTFTATAEVVEMVGAKPIFVDINPRTLSIDLSIIKKATSSRTKAILPVHFAGNPINLEKILDFCNSRRIKVIEDAAHAFGAELNGQKVGQNDSFCTVFSFYANKPITCGEGGLVVTKSSSVANLVRTMRSHGMSKDAINRFASPGNKWEYDVTAKGFKYNLPDVLAAIGVSQLAHAEQNLIKRNILATRYVEKLCGLPVEHYYPYDPGIKHSAHIFPIRLKEHNRDELIEWLKASEIGTSVHYKPLHKMSYWKNFSGSGCFENSEKYFDGCLTLPLYPSMKLSEVDEVVDRCADYLLHQNKATQNFRNLSSKFIGFELRA